MVEIRLDQDTLRKFTAFERVTGVRAKDCLEEEDRFVFLVDERFIGRAIGKGGVNIQRLQDGLKKDVDVFAYSEDNEKFVRHLFYRYAIEAVALNERKDGKHQARIRVEARDKGKAIGRNGRNVQMARQLLSRHSSVADVVVE